jgi:hypothetical protein
MAFGEQRSHSGYSLQDELIVFWRIDVQPNTGKPGTQGSRPTVTEGFPTLYPG